MLLRATGMLHSTFVNKKDFDIIIIVIIIIIIFDVASVKPCHRLSLKCQKQNSQTPRGVVCRLSSVVVCRLLAPYSL